MSARKVAVVTSVHHPCDTRIYYRQIRSLAEAGMHVLYIHKHVDSPCLEDIANVEHIALTSPYRIGRIIEAYRILKYLKPALAHLHDPELLVLTRGLRRKGIAVIADVHENYAHVAQVRSWIPTWLRPVVALLYPWIERRLLGYSNWIITADDRTAERLTAANLHNTRAVRNYPSLTSCPVEPQPPKDNRIVYLGSVGADRGLWLMLDMADILKSQGHSFRLEVIGPLRSVTDHERALAKINEAGLQNFVSLLGARSNPDALRHISGAGLGLVPALPSRFQDNVPTKIFEYAMLGIPVLVSKTTTTQELVGDWGELSEFEPGAFAEKAAMLLRNKDIARRRSKSARLVVEQEYCWERESPQLLEIYSRVLGSINNE